MWWLSFYQTCSNMFVYVGKSSHAWQFSFSIYSPLSSASITPSLQPTSQLYPLSHFFATIPLSFLHTTIRQTSYISNQLMCRSRSWVIGLTNCWHCTASTRGGWVHFHHVQPVYLNSVLPSVAPPILDNFDTPTHDSSAFSIYLPLSSASITPSLQPTSQLHPLSRFATIVGRFHRHSLGPAMIFSRYRNNVSRSTKNCVPATEWFDLPAVNIGRLAHAVGESIFTMFDQYT